MKINETHIEFSAVEENEAFARIAASAFMLSMNPTVEEIEDVKTAVSEAVTNAIIHGYHNMGGMIRMAVVLYDDRRIELEITDHGTGIADVEKAMEPLYTTGGEDRSGLGFSVMESFMDTMKVRSTVGKGTTVTMEKYIRVRRRRDDLI